MRVDLPIPGLPIDRSTWRGDGVLVSGNTARYQLVLRRGFTDTLRIIQASAPALQLTASERDSLLEATLAEQPEEWREAMRSAADVSQIPSARPVWTAIATDREHRIWVGLPGPGTDVATLHVFSSDGVLLGSVPAPHPRILDGYFTRDRIYLRDVDEAGRAMVRVFLVRRRET
jgi:hypothetical protein